MLFTFVITVAACHSFALRPEPSVQSRTVKFARFGLLAETASSDPVKTLKDAAAAVNSIMLEAGNATEYMSDDDKALLTSVVELVETAIYGSMDSSHIADEAAIAAAIADVQKCNSDYVARITEGGDLYRSQQNAIGLQNDLNGLQATVDAKTEVNTTKWSELSSHMSMISAAPACAEFPERSKPALDVYFENSEYADWYTDQQSSYAAVSSAFEIADADLAAALQAYDVGLARRDTSYCDWKAELEAGCGLFKECYQSKSIAYLATLKPALEEDMQARVEAYKAGQTIIAQINFLLGLTADSTPPTNIDTSRYELEFPQPPAEGSCVLEVLDEDMWTPMPVCIRAQLMRACTERKRWEIPIPYPRWGSPRQEWASRVAGEAVCCNSEGQATRHVDANGQALWTPANRNEQCTTTSGTRLQALGSPSHTFFEAKAICDRAALRLCSTQAELNTACDSGCWMDDATAWVQ